MLPDGSVDMILTDPPWAISREVVIHRSMNPNKYKYVGSDIKLDFGQWDHFESEDKYIEFTVNWMTEAVRVTKDKGHIVVFFDQNRSTILIEIARSLGCSMRQHLYWLKSNPVPRARKVDFMVALEHALWFTKGTKTGATFNYRYGQQPNYVRAPVVSLHNPRLHPTEKPVKVLSVWIRYLSNPGELICDPMAGSGSTCEAARKLGRRYLGIEKDEQYARNAARRLARIPAWQPDLLI